LSKGRTTLSKVFEMLNTCAKGYQAKLGSHSYIVTFGDRIK